MELITKQSPVGAGTGRKDIRASAKSGGSEPITRLMDVARNKVSRHIDQLRAAQKKLAETEGDESKAHQLPTAKHTVTMAYAELVRECITEIVLLHQGRKDEELVRTALDTIALSKVDGKEHTNPQARLIAESLLAEVKAAEDVGRRYASLHERYVIAEVEAGGEAAGVLGKILASNPRAIEEARSNISHLMTEVRDATQNRERDSMVALLAGWTSDISLLIQNGEGKDMCIAGEALRLIRTHATEERRRLAATAMLYTLRVRERGLGTAPGTDSS